MQIPFLRLGSILSKCHSLSRYWVFRKYLSQNFQSFFKTGIETFKTSKMPINFFFTIRGGLLIRLISSVCFQHFMTYYMEVDASYKWQPLMPTDLSSKIKSLLLKITKLKVLFMSLSGLFV